MIDFRCSMRYELIKRTLEVLFVNFYCAFQSFTFRAALICFDNFLFILNIKTNPNLLNEAKNNVKTHSKIKEPQGYNTIRVLDCVFYFMVGDRYNLLKTNYSIVWNLIKTKVPHLCDSF